MSTVKIIKLSIDEVVPGMVIGFDVKTDTCAVLIAVDTLLTPQHIEQLKQYFVEYVYIVSDGRIPPSKKVSVERIEEGMIMATDVISPNGVLLIPKETQIQKEHIDILLQNEIRFIRVMRGDTEEVQYKEKIRQEYIVADQSSSKTKILIVDDSKPIRMLLRKILSEDASIEIVGEADNGKVGVILAKELKPDIIIMDLAMEKMHGVAALKEAKKMLPDIKVIVLTAISKKEIIFECLNSGASSFILKPFTPEKVKEAINKVKETLKKPEKKYKRIG